MYTFSETKRVLDLETPLITRDQLLLICGDEIEDMTEDQSTSFITTAHVMLVSVLDGYGIPVILMTEIEKYLGGHFATLAFPSIQRDRLGPMSSTVFGKLGLGLQNTRYGQTAISLDPTGILKELSDGVKRPQVRLTSIGSGKIHYDEVNL